MDGLVSGNLNLSKEAIMSFAGSSRRTTRLLGRSDTSSVILSGVNLMSLTTGLAGLDRGVIRRGGTLSKRHASSSGEGRSRRTWMSGMTSELADTRLKGIYRQHWRWKAQRLGQLGTSSGQTECSPRRCEVRSCRKLEADRDYTCHAQ